MIITKTKQIHLEFHFDNANAYFFFIEYIRLQYLSSF